ncbi:MAG: universal stress protein [Halanaeroarchaeum sp.]
MAERILIPTDGSDEVVTVVDEALDLDCGGESEIHSLYVVDHRALVPLGEGEQQSVAEMLRDTGETALDTVSERVRDRQPDFDVSTMVAQGLPARQILAYAQEHEIDTIVLGSHGQTLQQQAIGSTTERVVRGVNQIENTKVVIVPIGDQGEREDVEEAISERASDMFQ